MGGRLADWADVAREGGREAFVAAVREATSREQDPVLNAAYQQASPVEQMYAGLERYWRKRAEAEQG